ncbi:hypothetical protein BJ165DRAFT_749145 [Panaeolus papilionaceus]|nr:hypothetical protein BJ165DRAFT_749145 [Panaeolus papilionaceus]
MPIFIVDTPGFSDVKLSDAGVFIELGKAVARKDTSPADTLLFTTPITETRLSGSKRRTIQMLRAFLGPAEDGNTVSMTVVTTMWDTVCTERTRQRAESNFAQLSDEIFKEFTTAGATVSRFMNTRDSALQMLDMRPWVPRDPQFRSGSSGFDAISPYLFRDIYIHLEAAIQEKQNIESQLSQQEAQSMPTLKAVLESNQKEAQEVLEGLFEQMRRLGLPPTGLDVFHRAFLKRVVGTHVPRSFPVRFYVFCCFVSRLVRAAKRRREKNVVEYTLDTSLLRLP